VDPVTLETHRYVSPVTLEPDPIGDGSMLRVLEVVRGYDGPYQIADDSLGFQAVLDVTGTPEQLAPIVAKWGPGVG
jgi:hypothetical protein